jgi:transcriptional regulator with XRE-family HTH domain
MIMLLGEIVKTYREERGLSQRDFAAKSGLSAGYISMLEKNRNPRTGDPIIPSLRTVKSIADAIGMTLDEIMVQMGDNLVSLNDEPIASSDDELNDRIMELVQKLPVDLKLSLVDLLQAAVEGVRKR